jgi:CRP-like cAMP-binding protein
LRPTNPVFHARFDLAGSYGGISDQPFAALVCARFFSPRHFHLTMSRTDIANYPHQALETISRVLRRFEHEGLLHIKQRDVKIVDLPRLQALACASSYPL